MNFENRVTNNYKILTLVEIDLIMLEADGIVKRK